jgi:hypothetical protein
VTLTVLKGKTMVAKLSVTCRKAGRGLVTWNGKIKRMFATSGDYKIVLRAVSPTGATARDGAMVRIA